MFSRWYGLVLKMDDNRKLRRIHGSQVNGVTRPKRRSQKSSLEVVLSWLAHFVDDVSRGMQGIRDDDDDHTVYTLYINLSATEVIAVNCRFHNVTLNVMMNVFHPPAFGLA